MLPNTLCQTKRFSCMGCCGHSYTKEQEVRAAIVRNTKDFPSTPIEEFSRKAEVLRACGVCRGVVEEKGRVFCALHPARHKGKDHRDKICDKEYLCKTMKHYTFTWDQKTKRAFLRFLEAKNHLWYEYSMNMDQDVYLNEFNKHLVITK